MLKRLNSEYFVDGYNVATGGSCLDMVIAGALGSIHKISYYEYLFSLSFYSNWGNIDDDWYKFRKELISKMNYEFLLEKFDTWDETLKYIIKCIDSGVYVLMPVTYDALFYNLNPTSASHFILIVGYDEEKDILLILDSNFVEHGLSLPREKYTLYQVAFKTSSVKDIWEKVLDLHPDSNFSKQIYGIVNKSDIHPSIDEWLYIVLDIWEQSTNKKSWFIKAIRESQQIKEKDEIGWYIIYLRDNYLGRLLSFFNYFNYSENVLLKKEIKPISDEFYEIRNTIISRIHIRLLRKEGITDEFIEDATYKIRTLDNELNTVLKKFR